MPKDFKRQIVELLKSLETGDRKPATSNPNKYTQHNLRVADGLAGFGAGAFFMIIGVVQFYLTRKYLGEAGLRAAPIHAAGGDHALVPRSKEWLRLWIGVAALALVVLSASVGWIPMDALRLGRGAAYVIAGMGILYFAYFFIFADLTTEERKRGVVLVVLFIGCALFFSGFEQAGSSLNLFAERYSNQR